MATFLVERYWPGVTPAGAADATARLSDAGAEVLETVLADTDEVCFWTIKAEAPGTIEAAFATAGVPMDRIAVVQVVPRRAAGRG